MCSISHLTGYKYLRFFGKTVGKKEAVSVAAAPEMQTWVGSGLLNFKQGGLSIIEFL